jgi:hypothetical protein
MIQFLVETTDGTDDTDKAVGCSVEPRTRNLLSLNLICTYFYVHAGNLTKEAQNQKTYRRFLGMIFWERSVSLLQPAWQRLAKDKSTKNWKNIK